MVNFDAKINDKRGESLERLQVFYHKKFYFNIQQLFALITIVLLVLKSKYSSYQHNRVEGEEENLRQTPTTDDFGHFVDLSYRSASFVYQKEKSSTVCHVLNGETDTAAQVGYPSHSSSGLRQSIGNRPSARPFQFLLAGLFSSLFSLFSSFTLFRLGK